MFQTAAYATILAIPVIIVTFICSGISSPAT